MLRHIAPVVTAALLMVSGAAVAASSSACDQCRKFPDVCGMMEVCVRNNCTVSPDQKKQCDHLFACRRCTGNSTCANLEYCIKNSCISEAAAASCRKMHR